MDFNQKIASLEFTFAQDLVFKAFNQYHLDKLDKTHYDKIKYYFSILPLQEKMRAMSQIIGINLTPKHVSEFLSLTDFSILNKTDNHLATHEQNSIAICLFRLFDSISHLKNPECFKAILHHVNNTYSFDDLLSQYGHKYFNRSQMRDISFIEDLFYATENKEHKEFLLKKALETNLFFKDSFGIIQFFNVFENEFERHQMFQVWGVPFHKNNLNRLEESFQHYYHIHLFLNHFSTEEKQDYLKNGKLLNQLVVYFLNNKHSGLNKEIDLQNDVKQYIKKYNIEDKIILKEFVLPVFSTWMELNQENQKKIGHDSSEFLSTNFEMKNLIEKMNFFFDSPILTPLEYTHFNKQEEYEHYIENFLTKIKLDIELDTSHQPKKQMKI